MHLLFVPVHTHNPTGESLPAEGDSDRSRNKEKNTYFLLILLGTVGALWDPKTKAKKSRATKESWADRKAQEEQKMRTSRDKSVVGEKTPQQQERTMRNEYEMAGVIKRQEKEIAALHEKCIKLKRQIELGLSDRETYTAIQSDLERTTERCKTLDDDLRNVQGLVCDIASKMQDAEGYVDSAYTKDELLEEAMNYVKTLIHYLDDAVGDSPSNCIAFTDI